MASALRLEIRVSSERAAELLRASFAAPDDNRWTAWPLASARSVGKFLDSSEGVEVELWREDPGLLGPAAPRFVGSLRGAGKGAESSVLEGRFAVRSQVLVLFFLVLWFFAGLGFAFGRHNHLELLGCIVSGLLVPGALSGVMWGLSEAAKSVLRREIFRAVHGTAAPG